LIYIEEPAEEAGRVRCVQTATNMNFGRFYLPANSTVGKSTFLHLEAVMPLYAAMTPKFRQFVKLLHVFGSQVISL
jgi:hypothetical protein